MLTISRRDAICNTGNSSFHWGGLGIPTPVYALSAFVNAASAPKSTATDGEKSWSGAARVLAANKTFGGAGEVCVHKSARTCETIAPSTAKVPELSEEIGHGPGRGHGHTATHFDQY